MKINGRQRHVLVDTQGLLVELKVRSAPIMDRDGSILRLVSIREQLPRLRLLWHDSGYTGGDKGKDRVQKVLGWSAEIVRHPRKLTHILAPQDRVMNGSTILPSPGFRALPRRSAGERTFSWCGQRQRLSKEDERLCETSEVPMYIAMTRMMVHRPSV